MKHSLKTKIVGVLSLSLLLIMASIVLVTDWRVRSIVDMQKWQEATHRLDVIFGVLKRWERKLHSTGMEEVYLEPFQNGVLREISRNYYSLKSRQFPFIVNEFGEIVLHPFLKKGDQTLSVLSLTQGNGYQETEYQDASGKSYWVVYRQFPAWGWIVGWVMPASVKYQAKNQLMSSIIIIVMISFIFLLGIIWFLVSLIVRPVEVMTAKAQAMALGDLDVEIPNFGQDNELSALTNSLNKLKLSIKDKISKLKKSEKQYRDLVQGANSVILRADLEGRILFINDFGLRLFGYQPEEIIGQPIVGTITPRVDSQGRNLKEMVDMILQYPEEFLINENENICKGGRRIYIQWTNRSIQDEDGRFIELLCVGIDITKRKALEKELVQRQKMEALADLARGIAHDFKNILAGIFASLELAQLHAQGVPKALQALERVHKAAVKAKELVEQIVAFTRGELGKRVEVELQPLLQEVLQIISPSLSPGVEIKTVFRASPVVWADPTQVFQVVMNLCTNALQAMGAQGCLTLSLDVVQLEEQGERRPVGSKGVFACLQVADNGPGMSEDVLERIFEPYFTTKDRQKGTGLGLFVVHNVVKNHGGFIKVKSAPGQGAAFEVYLPVADAVGR